MKLRQIRLDRGLTVPQLVEKSGVPRRTIQDIEKRDNCRIDIAIKLADALNVTLDELCRDENEKGDVIMNLKKRDDGMYFLEGDFREDIENDNEQGAGLHLVNCDIEEYDEDGIYFYASENSEVYVLEIDGKRCYYNLID